MTANPHGFTLNHTMLRVKDPEKSLEFYCGVLGMTLLRKTDIEAGEFSLYFLGFTGSDDEVPAGDADDAGSAPGLGKLSCGCPHHARRRCHQHMRALAHIADALEPEPAGHPRNAEDAQP